MSRPYRTRGPPKTAIGSCSSFRRFVALSGGLLDRHILSFLLFFCLTGRGKTHGEECLSLFPGLEATATVPVATKWVAPAHSGLGLRPN